ncbi:MAG: type III-A CRISPR-associated protein Csm2 [Desulfococcaceae bacterium]|jgi:CRISPR-associated protein Csm2|nr:type III-A CRISPR-associated protein Csm2 [Desulfococcaceae bacterium]
MSENRYQKEIDAIIIENDAKILVETAQKIAGEMIQIKRNGKGIDEGASVSTSQIRNIYGSSKKIEMSLDKNNMPLMYNRLILLKPKMAYANGRFNKKLRWGDKIPGFKTLVDSLSYAIDKVDGDYDRMKNFFNFFEAILAYHKAEGGK